MARTSVGAAALCLHCGAPPIPGEPYCCAGCETVHGLLERWGLERYYDLRGLRAAAVQAPALEASDRKWLEPHLERLAAAPGLTRISLSVAGVHCSACVWLIGELFGRQGGGARCEVNPARGSVALDVEPRFDLSAFADALESVGYPLAPAVERAVSRGLTMRMGVCLALAANVMMLSLALYFGLADGRLHTLARQLVFGLSTASVAIGGSHFAVAAWRGLRGGLLHLDLPIALGVGLAWLGSAASYLSGDPRGEFFDTVAVFVALMLVGRWAQEQALAKNRVALHESMGAEGLFTRRLRDGRPELVRCPELGQGDTLLLARGDLIPVDAELASEARLRLDWIDGESAERPFPAGSVAPAGAFLSSSAAVRARATTDFASSPLIELLSVASEREPSVRFWDRLARLYVGAVLVLAAVGFALYADDLGQALRVATAVLVVTCPCAIGIAAPLAYEWVHARARRRGLFVRRAGTLDRALAVRQVVLDKTGTLTTGAPTIVDAAPLETLEQAHENVLFELAARSTHPKARALLATMAPRALRPELVTDEQLSRGVQARLDGVCYRLGEPSWAASEGAGEAHPDADLVFSADSRALACFETEEALREGAAEEIAALEAMGLDVWILSGDRQDRVDAIASRVGVPPERALAERTADDKASWLRARGGAEHTLFVGDGINDVLAADEARLAGTPAIDRPFMAGRCDFYFTSPGLGAIRALLLEARRLRRVVRADVAFAVVYNAAAVALAYAGLLAPWVAAAIMPISSLATLGGNALALRAGGLRLVATGGETPWTR